jgi:glutamine amidotransferase-like uncharacterized protein
MPILYIISFMSITNSLQFIQNAIETITLAPPKSIILYNGVGAGPNCVIHTKIALEALLAEPVQTVDAQFLQNTDWMSRTKLLVIPGGLSTDKIHYAIGKEGLRNIQRAVEIHRVAFLGICAGAYLVSERMCYNGLALIRSFENSTPIFFSGTAAGAAHKLNIRKIAYTIGTTLFFQNCFFLNGPTFLDASKKEDTEILAHYADDNAPPSPAIIHCRNSRINAILCGFHPEFTTENAIVKANEAEQLNPAYSYVIWHRMLGKLRLLPSEDITPLPAAVNAIIYSYLFASKNI